MAYTTIAVKGDTYEALSELKARYGFKSFDDVVKMLIKCAEGQR
jgi:predicted CopG family antitoxin